MDTFIDRWNAFGVLLGNAMTIAVGGFLVYLGLHTALYLLGVFAGYYIFLCFRFGAPWKGPVGLVLSPFVQRCVLSVVVATAWASTTIVADHVITGDWTLAARYGAYNLFDCFVLVWCWKTWQPQHTL